MIRAAATRRAIRSTLNILTNDALGDGTTPVPPGDVTVALDQTSVPGGVLNGDGSVTVPGGEMGL